MADAFDGFLCGPDGAVDPATLQDGDRRAVQEFADFLRTAGPPPSRKMRTSSTNPKSQNGDDPYVDLDAEDIPPFRVTDPTSTVFDHPETFEIHEVSWTRGRTSLNGYGFRVLRSGQPAARPCGDAIPLEWADLPVPVRERLQRA